MALFCFPAPKLKTSCSLCFYGLLFFDALAGDRGRRYSISFGTLRAFFYFDIRNVMEANTCLAYAMIYRGSANELVRVLSFPFKSVPIHDYAGI